MLQYKGIRDCACVPFFDKTSGQVPKIFLVLQNVDKFDRVTFMQFLEGNLDANKIPKYVEIIDEIPRASNGKIQRKKLTLEYK